MKNLNTYTTAMTAPMGNGYDAAPDYGCGCGTGVF